jgi:DNA adenine methylase
MTEAEHRKMLVTIRQCQGKVMLSEYPNPLYDQQLADWRRNDFRIDNKAASGQSKRQMTESVWMNF